MRAGVRPGLQILWVCLRWTGRFDSDSLPPSFTAKWQCPSLRVQPGYEPFHGRTVKNVRCKSEQRSGRTCPTLFWDCGIPKGAASRTPTARRRLTILSFLSFEGPLHFLLRVFRRPSLACFLPARWRRLTDKEPRPSPGFLRSTEGLRLGRLSHRTYSRIGNVVSLGE